MSDDRLWPLLHVSELGDIPPPKWLVEDVLTDGLTVVYGPSGAGKTFVALSMMLACSAGTPWFGHATAQTPVVYVSGEGVGGLNKRVKAWSIAEHTAPGQIYVIPAGVRFGAEREHAVALRADIHAIGAGVVVIDTLARSMAGQDENSAQDMGQVIQSADWLREKTGCGVVIVHHSGVDGTRPRGSTALFGAADTLIRVDGQGQMLQVACEKQKDAARFNPLSFALVPAGSSVALSPRRPSPAEVVPTPF